jgi:hypothetical protein
MKLRYKGRHHRLGLCLAALLAGMALVPAASARPATTSPAQALTCAWRDLGNLNRNVAYAASAMDTTNGVMYVYGGYGDDSTNFQTESGVSSITFGATFTKADTKVAAVSVSGAQEREALAGAYRPKGDDSAIYWIAGRNGTGAANNDTYSYNIKTKVWQRLNTTGTFANRYQHAAAYDPLHDVVWVAAGATGSCSSPPCGASNMPTNYLAFDASTGAASWHEGPTGGPRAKGGVMVYDSAAKRMIFFGGTVDGTKGSNLLMQLDLSDADITKAKWSNLAASGTGPTVVAPGAAYDAAHNWFVTYGGSKSDYDEPGKEVVETRTFALDLSVTPAVWKNLNTSVGERAQLVMEYEPRHKGIVMSSGRIALPDPPSDLNKRSIHGLTCEAAAVPTPTPTRESGAGGQACARLQGRVPQAVINDALANPSSIFGWDLPCNPSLPPGPNNPLRRQLGLRNASVPYHPVFNGLVWKCGCS